MTVFRLMLACALVQKWLESLTIRMDTKRRAEFIRVQGVDEWN